MQKRALGSRTEPRGKPTFGRMKMIKANDPKRGKSVVIRTPKTGWYGKQKLRANKNIKCVIKNEQMERI